MTFIPAILKQTRRNMFQTWKTQILVLFTISLSILIFSFFYLIYTNMVIAGQKLGNDLKLVVYLEEEPSRPLQEEYKDKILTFGKVEKVDFVSRQEAYQRFKLQLAQDADLLDGVDKNFLPPSIEIYPLKKLSSLVRIKRFSDYLQTMPGVLKVQYGREWIDRFYTFMQLIQIVIFLSGTLLILTTAFMVSHSIRLSLVSRAKEINLLHLLGATSTYIRVPYFIEGCLQGMLGALLGLSALFILFNWIKLKFGGTAFLDDFYFSFFSPLSVIAIIAISTILCGTGSFISTSKKVEP